MTALFKTIPTDPAMVGCQQYVACYDESAWDTAPGSITYRHTPIDSYGVNAEPIVRQADPMDGNRQARHQQIIGHRVRGRLAMSLQPWYFTAGAAPSQGEYFLGGRQARMS